MLLPESLPFLPILLPKFLPVGRRVRSGWLKFGAGGRREALPEGEPLPELLPILLPEVLPDFCLPFLPVF